MKGPAIVFLAVTFGLVWWYSDSFPTAAIYLAVGVALWAAAHYLRRQSGGED